jgi:alpha-helical uncharacterized protein
MAPGLGLEIPRLATGCLDPFQPLTTYSGAFTLARNLLLAGVGASEDWARCNGDPMNFMLHTLKRSATGFDQRAIDSVAHTNIVFGTCPSTCGWRESTGENPNQVFVAVEATHISIVYLRETLELLAKAEPRLPATFYRMLLDSISQWILCYDESAAESYFEYRMECYEEAKASGDAEGLEKPQPIEDARGPWLANRFRRWPARQIPAVIASVGHGSGARRILEATATLLALARKRKRTRPDWKAWEECFPNGSYTIPFTVLAFHEQDLVCQAFQNDEEDWLNSGEESSPAFFAIADPNDPNSIKTAFDELTHFLSMVQALGRLFALLPGVDLLEVEN